MPLICLPSGRVSVVSCGVRMTSTTNGLLLRARLVAEGTICDFGFWIEKPQSKIGNPK
jgi:hypothetical protein